MTVLNDPLKAQFLRQLDEARDLGLKYGRVEGLLDAARILQDEALKSHGAARGVLMLSASHLAKIAKERHEALKNEYATGVRED